jgi:hypothetical protein
VVGDEHDRCALDGDGDALLRLGQGKNERGQCGERERGGQVASPGWDCAGGEFQGGYGGEARGVALGAMAAD